LREAVDILEPSNVEQKKKTQRNQRKAICKRRLAVQSKQSFLSTGHGGDSMCFSVNDAISGVADAF
jgi:hypothetical protein